MFIPKEYDLEARLGQILGIPSDAALKLIYDVCKSHPGLLAEEFVRELCDAVKAKGHADLDPAIQQICKDSVDNAKLQSDAIATLSVLRKRGLKLTLISNTSPLSKTRIERLGLSEFFDNIVLSCDVGYLKPDPRIFLHAMASMNVTPAHTCIVGDRIRTIVLGGAILHARCVLVERRMRESIVSEQIPVEAIVPSLSDLLELPFLGGQRG
jgi:HAD superfamily hydrolase (TIGR01509 family)